MVSVTKEEKKYIIIALHILSFLFLILPGVLSFDSPHFILPFILMEVALFVPLLYKMEFKYFYMIWQFQFFLLLFLSLYYRPLSTLNIKGISDTALYGLFFILIVIEISVASYLILGEVIIKKLLFSLSFTTTIVVFLIVIFIMSEGAPAFQENDPVEFLTGSEWHPFYSRGYTNDIEFKTVVDSYDFDIDIDDHTVYFTDFDRGNITISVINTGGRSDTIHLSINGDPDVDYDLQKETINLEPSDSEEVNLSLEVSVMGEYDLTIRGSSNSSDLQKDVELSLIKSDMGVDVSPEEQYLTGDESSSGYVFKTVDITNLGLYEEEFLITFDDLENFRPSVTSDEIDWNYTTGTGSVTLEPKSTVTAKLTPRMINNIEGEFTINMTVQSVSHPQIKDDASIIFTHIFEELMDVGHIYESISPDGTANYTIKTSGNGTNVDIVIDNVPEGWDIELFYDGENILDDEGKTTLGQNITGEVLMYLHVSGQDLDEGDSSNILFTLKKGSSSPTFGILPFIIGTLITSAIAVAIAAPLGLGCAIFLSEYANTSIKKILRPLFELLAGIPSVIYGLWGFLTLGPLLGNNLYPYFGVQPSFGRNLMTASIVLSVMILPIIISLSADAISSVRRELHEASTSLGSTRWQTIKNVILPCAKSGIIASIILGTGRAIGETMAVVMIMGAPSKIPSGVFEPVGTMTSVIAITFGWSFSYDRTRHAIFAIGTILFFMVFALNIIIFKVQKKNRAREDGGRSRFKELISDKFDKIKSISFRRKDDEDKSKKITQLKKDADIDVKSKFKMPDVAVERERYVKYILIIGSIFVTIMLFYIIGDIIIRGGTTLQLKFFLEREYMGGKGGGFVNAITGSLSLVAIALAVAAPLSIGSALYVQEYAKENNIVKRIVLFTSDTLASTPSIVFGAFGFMFFVLYLEFGFSMLAGGFTLGFMIIPILLRSSIESLKSVPQSYRNASLALGASKWQTIKKVVVPPAIPSISSGLIISIGRAIGETAAVLLTAGYAAHIATSIMHPTASMPNLIYKYYQLSAKWPILRAKVYSSAMVLIIVVLILNGISKLINYKYSKLKE